MQAVLRGANDYQHSSTTARSNTKRLVISHLVSRLSQLLPQQKRVEATACVAAVLCFAGCSEHETSTAVVKSPQQARQLHWCSIAMNSGRQLLCENKHSSCQLVVRLRAISNDEAAHIAKRRFALLLDLPAKGIQTCPERSMLAR